MNRNAFDPASFFTPLENTRPFLKVGAQGFTGSGKTFTLGLLAIKLHQRLGSEKPIVIFDTERAAKFLKPLFLEAGIKAVERASRSVSDLATTLKLCEEGYADIVMIDSITHLWDSHLAAYKRAGMARRRGCPVDRITDADTLGYRIEITDWADIKAAWRERVSEPFVNSAVHILMAGRAAWEYEKEVTEQQDGRKKTEWNKSGIKMRVEGEMSYEPDLLFNLERVQTLIGDQPQTHRECTILKDRSNLLEPNLPIHFPSTRDWRIAASNVWGAFQPVVEFLLSGQPVAASDVPETNDAAMFATDEQRSERRRRVAIALEEIEGELVAMHPSTGATDKKGKGDKLEQVFGTRSWTAVTLRSLEDLQRGAATLKELRRPSNIVALPAATYPGPLTDASVNAAALPVAEAIDLAKVAYSHQSDECRMAREGCDILGLSVTDRLRLWRDHDGNYVEILRTLNRTLNERAATDGSTEPVPA